MQKVKKDRRYLNNWGPLTLLVTVYKLVSAIFAFRLKPALDKVTGPHQKAYIPGWFIGECTWTMYDIFAHAMKNNLLVFYFWYALKKHKILEFST